MNEFNTLRLLTFEPLPEYRKFFKDDDLHEIENIFISVARSNSFLFLSKKQISDSRLKKITNFLTEVWDHTCLATTLRTFFVPKESPLLNINFFKNQLNKEDYDRTTIIDSLLEKSEIFEEKIELLLHKI